MTSVTDLLLFTGGRLLGGVLYYALKEKLYAIQVCPMGDGFSIRSICNGGGLLCLEIIWLSH